MATRATNTTIMIHWSRFKIITHKCISVIKFTIYYVPQYCPLPKLLNDSILLNKGASRAKNSGERSRVIMALLFHFFFSKNSFKHTICVSNSGCGFREGSGSLLLSDQITSFSWRYLRKMRYNQQAEPPFLHVNPFYRNPGSAP